MSEPSTSEIQDFEDIPIPVGAGILAAVDDAFLACVADACGHEGE